MAKQFEWLPEHVAPSHSALYDEDKAILDSEAEDDNPYLVDTGGFVPLKVKIQRMQEQGIIAQFQASEFDSQDYTDMYLHPDTMIRPDDDLEDIREKLALRESIRQEIIASHKAEGDASVATATTSEPIDKQSVSADTKDSLNVSDKTEK